MTDGGKWRRVAALRALVQTHDPRARSLLRRALADEDSEVVGAAVRILGETGETWAADELVEALRRGGYSRSRIATQLDRFAPRLGQQLEELLDARDPAVRFWAATLAARCSDVAPDRLARLTNDADANVRAAATESLGERGDRDALAAVRKRLHDDIWFVRVHACRAVGRLGGAREASVLARSLRDPWWWVRTAAKDALRGLGIEAAAALVPMLDDADVFARNGAAEVLQDIGFVDMLARHGHGELLERIYASGGSRLRAAALARREDDARTSTAARALAS